MTDRFVVGCMTGTSLDGLDAALVRVTGRGLSMRAAPLGFVSRELGLIAGPLRAIASQEPASAGKIAAVCQELSRLHADAIREVLDGRRADLVCVHGQTIFHSPPISWQLIQPAIIADAIGCPVVFDLRAADLARGGLGAPITPLADVILFGSAHERRVVINLGGFANFSAIPSLIGDVAAALPDVAGGDICACNQLLDAIARTRLGAPFDRGGAASLGGKLRSDVVAKIESLLSQQYSEARSLGTGDEIFGQLDQIIPAASLPGPDLARAACSAIARVIADRVGDADRVIVAGGGVRNLALAQALQRAAACPVEDSTRHGVDPQAREAVAFAVLGALCQDRVPITLPQITRLKGQAPISGAWVYP